MSLFESSQIKGGSLANEVIGLAPDNPNDRYPTDLADLVRVNEAPPPFGTMPFRGAY